MEYKKAFSKFIKRFIGSIISHPRLIVLLPSIIVFTLSYDVTYDYTIKEINSRIASYFGSNVVSSTYDSTRVMNFIDSLEDGYQEKFQLTTFELGNKNLPQKKNVLTFEFLHEVNQLQFKLYREHNDLTIISPLSSWTIDWNTDDYAAPEHKREFNNYILRIVNSDMYSHADSPLINDINKVNHIITACETLRFYVISNSTKDIRSPIISYIDDSNYLKVKKITSSNDLKGFSTFVNYYINPNSSSSFINLMLSFIKGVEIISLIGFVVYISIAMANQHKIRSNCGLLIAWIVEVLLSCGAAINILGWIDNHNSRTSEQLSIFTAGAYIFTIMVVSSKNMFRIINELADDDYVNGSNEVIHKKLYKFYLGIGNGVSNDKIINNINNILKSSKLINSLLHNYICIPTITIVLILDIFLIALVKIIGLCIFKFTLHGDIQKYLTSRLSYFLGAICIALIIDHTMQLTYLVGIIIIDLKRYDLTDLLNYQSLSRDESLTLSNNPYEGNLLSYLLLKFNYPSHLRPSRKSFRFKLGEYLLKIRYSTSLTTWIVILPIIESAYLLVLFIKSQFRLPFTEIYTSTEAFNLGTFNILRDDIDFTYYMEYACILVCIICLSLITFKLTHSDSLENKAIKINEKDFELEEKNIFKYIDLSIEEGHTLDVLKIVTNSNCSFIVSVGLDHKVMIWSPLIKPISRPIHIPTLPDFWPLNHINISSDGEYTILVNYRNRLVKCFERKNLAYSWQCELPQISSNKIKILESFFRKRTVPGFLSRKILLQQKIDRQNRRGSSSSLASINSNINGNFPIMMNSIDEKTEAEDKQSELEKRLNRDDFIMVLESGELITISCNTGTLKTFDIFSSVYGSNENVKLNSVKKLITPRVNDRIICHVNNYDIIIAANTNNDWKFRLLKIHEGYYNKGIHFSLPPPLSASNSLNETNDYAYQHKKAKAQVITEPCETVTNSKMEINKPTIVTVEFVGMIIRVNNLVAELIDMQGGIVLKRFHVGRFKPHTFKVSHLEPTHCKFCGCVSIQSFSILYEDYDEKTIIVHTFKIDANRSKNNICLRVERDPREIRCHGFSSVSEHLHWYENVECWQLTDINMIIGIKKSFVPQEEDIDIIDDVHASNTQSISTLIESSGLQSLRSRKRRLRAARKNASWEGFIVTLIDGNLLYYTIPECSAQKGFIVNKITCAEKFGYKSMVVNFGNLIKIIYLGNDKLIEENLYYSGTTTRSLPLPTNNLKGPSLNHDLLFINKRSKHNLHRL